jgi:lipopolysaccharide export system permease protein
MPLIERYILRRTAQIFLLALGALTGALWVTMVLRELDVVTAKGQAIWIFLLMTVLGLPALVQFVAPVALLLGILVALNSLTNDSELPIISAAGAPPRTVSRPIAGLALVVMLATAVSHHFLAPASLSMFRTILTQVRADVIATLVQDGSFRELDSRLTMHFRQRTPDGGFRDVFINDERDPKEARTFSAARGLLVDHAGGPFLVLEDGDIIRENLESEEGGVVSFETYALDLRQLGPSDAAPVFKAMERSTLFLLDPPSDEPYIEAYPQRVRAELHDRITAPLYTLVFAFIALGFMARPRTSRQNRALAIACVVLACLGLRAAGYAAMAVGREVNAAIPFLYAIPLAGLAFGTYASLHDTRGWITPWMETRADAIAQAARRIFGRRMTAAEAG